LLNAGIPLAPAANRTPATTTAIAEAQTPGKNKLIFKKGKFLFILL